MMGLLDALMTGKFTDDPEQNAAMQQGLLQFGLNLMSRPGGLAQALGQSGLAAMQGVNQYKQQQFQGKLQKEQLADIERRRKQQAAEDQFRADLVSPQMQASQAALAGGGGPTVANAQRMPPVDPNMSMLYGATKAGLMSPLDYVRSQQKDSTPIKLGAGEKLLKPGTYQELASNPKEDATDPFVRLLKSSGIDPMSPHGQKMLRDRLVKESSHQPAASIVNYGSPTAVDLGNGQTGLVQFGNRPGAPIQLAKHPVTGEPLKPAKDPNAAKPGEAQKKQVAGIDALALAVDEYVKELDSFPITGILSPNDRARIGTKYNNMMLQGKEAYNLGVLNGPDYSILQSVVADPVSLRGITTSNRSLKNQAKELKRMMLNVRGQITKTDGAADADPLGLR